MLPKRRTLKLAGIFTLPGIWLNRGQGPYSLAKISGLWAKPELLNT